MNRRGLEIYQYLFPAILAPLSFWLWWETYRHDIRLTLLAWLLPIIYAYVVPGIGTNVLKVWEFDTRLRLGRFRPHHGFVFGSATATLAWLCRPGPTTSYGDLLLLTLLTAAVLAIVNLLYDIKAIDAGLLRVYNQPWADGRDARAIALDYAPWFFGGFGLVYGAGIGGAELLARAGAFSGAQFAVYFAAVLLLAIAVPVWGYRRRSWRLHGHSGCRPITRRE